MQHIAIGQFDPRASYEARRPFLSLGVQFQAKDPFNLNTVGLRRSRIYFDRRLIIKSELKPEVKLDLIGPCLFGFALNYLTPVHDHIDHDPIDPSAELPPTWLGMDSLEVPSPIFTVVKHSLGWWDVVDELGKTVNDKALRKTDADRLAEG